MYIMGATRELTVNTENIADVLTDDTITSANSKGKRCRFVPLGDGSNAAKMYLTEKERDFCMDMQRQASKHNIGPIVYNQIDLPHNAYWCFGYITQVVEVCIGIANWGMGESPDDEIDKWEAWDEAIAVLTEKLYQLIGYELVDDHQGNVGINSQGDFICIDFGFEDCFRNDASDDIAEGF